jgi:hypothetical protein
MRSEAGQESMKCSKMIVDATKPITGPFPEMAYPKIKMTKEAKEELSKHGIT